jgi:hypothetical protein
MRYTLSQQRREGGGTMSTLKIHFAEETFLALLASATAERRPVDMHVEVVIRRALGLQFPFPQASQSHASEPALEPAHAE